MILKYLVLITFLLFVSSQNNNFEENQKAEFEHSPINKPSRLRRFSKFKIQNNRKQYLPKRGWKKFSNNHSERKMRNYDRSFSNHSNQNQNPKSKSRNLQTSKNPKNKKSRKLAWRWWHGRHHRGHIRNGQWFHGRIPRLFEQDQHVPVPAGTMISGTPVPPGGRVNMWRVRCRLNGNCGGRRRRAGFEPEILAPRRAIFSGQMGRAPPPNMPIFGDIPENILRRAVHDPTDELVNHLSEFGTDRTVTLWLVHLFRQGRLPNDINGLNLIDRNFFVGSHRQIGNLRISERRAINTMNFDQFMRHKEIQLTTAMTNQRLVSDFANEKANYRTIINFRRQRAMVHESIIQMENIIYLEQDTLIRNIKQRRAKFDADLARSLNETMKEIEKQPYYRTIQDRRDIFRD